MTENIANKKGNDVIERKSTGNARNRTHQTYIQATLISSTKAIIKSRDAIKRRSIGKRNMNLSDYAQN